MRLEVRVDPKWSEISASLRDNSLYVKLPLHRCESLLLNLTSLSAIPEVPQETKEYLKNYLKFLNDQIRETIEAQQASLFYAVPVETAEEDIRHLQEIEHLDFSGQLALFRAVLEKGLKNDWDVDWISRVGGPKK